MPSTATLRAESAALRRAEPEVAEVDAKVPLWLDLLADEDPVRRDEIGYTELAFFVLEKGLVSEPAMRDAVATLLPRLQVPTEEGTSEGDDTRALIGRSFAALGLSVLASRDATTPFLSAEQRAELVAATLSYARSESDYRPRDADHGWLHAAAHTADLLKFLARADTASEVERVAILDAAADIIVRPHGYIFHHGEDGRLAMTIFEVFKRAVPESAQERFLTRLTEPFGTQATMPFDGKVYAAQRNARAVLLSLFTLLSSPADKPASAEALRAAVAKRLF